MKKSKIYTKTGDKGETGLLSGERVKKSDSLLDVYGDIDEFNSNLGYLSSLMPSSYDEIRKFLYEIQSNMMIIGSYFACSKEKRKLFKLPKIKENDIEKLENLIDQMDSELDPLKHFLIFGGPPFVSYTHVCRSVCRRVERKAIEDKDKDLDLAHVYINRLSDYLFVLSRYLNLKEGQKEVCWPGKDLAN